MRLLAIIVLLLFLTGCKGNTVSLDGHAVAVEVADTPEKRTEGLMFRNSLGEDAGMLFVFDEPQEVSFWMKNTEIPLDIIFADEEGVVSELYKDVQPCLLPFCPTYASHSKVKYALEVNAGYAEKNGIQAGSKLDI